VNLWLVLLLADQGQRPRAHAWWEATDSNLAFMRAGSTIRNPLNVIALRTGE